MLVDINLIDVPSGLVSLGATETYFERLKAGRRLAPIFVKTIFNSDHYLLIDGKNRLAAAKRVGATEVEVEVV